MVVFDVMVRIFLMVFVVFLMGDVFVFSLLVVVMWCWGFVGYVVGEDYLLRC